MRNGGNVFDRAQDLFEVVIVRLLQVIVAVVIALAMVELISLLYDSIGRNLFTNGSTESGVIKSVSDLQRAVQRAFSAVLLVILGLEILETLRTYFVEHRVKLQIVVVVALIAVSRHIIQLDFEHVAGSVLAGMAALVVALTGSYFLM